MWTGTHGGSETSLNTVVHENVKIFFWNFLKFFQKLPSAYIFTNCTNFSKFVKSFNIVLDTCSNFIKLSTIFNIFWKKSINFKVICICKNYINSFIIYPSFLNNFSITLKFSGSFSEYSFNFFFQNFNEYYSTLIRTFSNFCCIFSTVPQSLIEILSSFLQILQIFFRRFTQNFDKITVEVCSNFYSDLLNPLEAIRNLVTPVATLWSVRPGFFNSSGHTSVCQTGVF